MAAGFLRERERERERGGAVALSGLRPSLTVYLKGVKESGSSAAWFIALRRTPLVGRSVGVMSCARKKNRLSILRGGGGGGSPVKRELVPALRPSRPRRARRQIARGAAPASSFVYAWLWTGGRTTPKREAEEISPQPWTLRGGQGIALTTAK